MNIWDIVKCRNSYGIFLVAFFLCTLEGRAQYELKSDLPAIYINTFDGQDVTSKDVYKYCVLRYVDETGAVTPYDSTSIKGRGNSTWRQMSKKPYKIKFLTKQKFLGKGYAKAKKWTLLANAGDKTMLRNALTFELGQFCAAHHEEGAGESLPFNPATRFVDLFMNDRYDGTYQISDQVEVRPHRVDVTEQNYPLGEDDDITGGYLLEVDGFKDGNYFVTTNYAAPVRIHYPDEDEIADRQNTYIRNHVNRFDVLLKSTVFADSAKGYRAYVDSASLIDWYLCTEISANIDGFYSTYFYKEQGDNRFFWGPLWDYDIAYNNDQRVKSEQHLSSSVNSLMVDIAYSGSREWVRRMWEDPWFQKKVYARYVTLLEAGLVDFMLSKVDSLQGLLAQSQELNYQRWGIQTKAYHEMVLYSSYDQYVSDLKTFVTAHCAYLKEAFYDKKPLEPTPSFSPAPYYYHIVNSNTQKAVSASGTFVQQMSNDLEAESQDWYVKVVGDHFQLVNREMEMALNDPTEGEVGATVNVGTTLNLAVVDEHDDRQLWNLVPQGYEGYYNLENVYTQHVANLRGGSSADGTDILSYTSNEKNATSKNRLWRLVRSEALPPNVTGIGAIEPSDYALAYNPETRELHFGCDHPEELTFMVSVYALDGKQVGIFRADQRYSLGGQPAGIYVIRWTVGGQQRTVKVRLP